VQNLGGCFVVFFLGGQNRNFEKARGLKLQLSHFFGGGGDIIGWLEYCLFAKRVWRVKLREFNLPLLGKWCWRMLVDGGGFWYRVLVARYGEEAGKLGARVVLFGGGR